MRGIVWMAVLGACYSPPELTAEVVVDIGPCGAPTRKVLIQTEPDATVLLYRDDEMVSDHEADETGLVSVRWPDTSFEGVQARVGREDNFNAQDLVPPPPELYPVWREGRVLKNACPDPDLCDVRVSGATLQVSSYAGGRIALGVAGTEPSGSSTVLTADHIAEWRFPVIQDGEACAHLEGPAVQLILPDGGPAITGRLWWSKQQALSAVADVARRSAGRTSPSGTAVLAVEERRPMLTPPTELVRVFGDLERPSDVAAVIELLIDERMYPADCAPDRARHRWTVVGTRIDVATNARREALAETELTECRGPTDLPIDPQEKIDEVIAELSGG